MSCEIGIARIVGCTITLCTPDSVEIVWPDGITTKWPRAALVSTKNVWSTLSKHETLHGIERDKTVEVFLAAITLMDGPYEGQLRNGRKYRAKFNSERKLELSFKMDSGAALEWPIAFENIVEVAETIRLLEQLVKRL